MKRSFKLASLAVAVTVVILSGQHFAAQAQTSNNLADFRIDDHLSLADKQALLEFILSLPVEEQTGVFVIYLPDGRIISNLDGEAEKYGLMDCGDDGCLNEIQDLTYYQNLGYTWDNQVQGWVWFSGGGSGGGGGSSSGGTGGSGSEPGGGGSSGGTGGVNINPVCWYDSRVLNTSGPPNYQDNFVTTSQYNMPAATASQFARVNFFSGMDSGIFRRVTVNADYNFMQATTVLPELKSLYVAPPQNPNKPRDIDNIYHYFGMDAKREIAGVARSVHLEAGFFFDGNNGSCTYAPWKPYLVFKPSDDSFHQLAFPKGGHRVFLPPGREARLSVRTLDKAVAVRYKFEGQTIGVENATFGFIDTYGVWTKAGTGVRPKWVSSVARNGPFKVDTNGGTRVAGLNWSNISLGRNGVAPRPVVASDIAAVLHYYGQDPYGPEVLPNPGEGMVMNSTAIRNQTVNFSNEVTSIRLVR